VPEQPSPTPSPTPSNGVPTPTAPGVIGSPTPKPSGKPSPSPSAKTGAKKQNASLPAALTQQPFFDIPALARTAPQNTLQLVQELTPLTKFGFSLQQVLVQGMGRFPVAGVAFWHDDWLEPRPHPTPHLHHGLDIFADFGTPIRAPDDGDITGMGDASSDPLGGTNVFMRASDGTEYYFAHLQSRPAGEYVGQHVKVGTVIGFVGNSGDAAGGPPHLHFEVHKPGPVPPKPYVDKWLADAEAYAPTWVRLESEAFTKHQTLQGGPDPTPERSAADLDTTMLLTLLDPVGGSVGLLPRLNLAPPTAPVSNLLWDQLIRLRLDGHILVPGQQSIIQGD
jgi:murein DD-endopeptidase MepM/ murein hydrolase activator NlpD